MNHSCKSKKNLLWIAGVLIGLVLMMEGFLRTTGTQAEYAENNLQANLSRIGQYDFEPPPENLILGSSLSARLLPSLFPAGSGGFGNLALDGAGVPMGLEIVKKRKERPLRIYLEANSIFFRSLHNEQMLRQAISNPIYTMSRFLYCLRPGSRPSALLYAWLKKTREANDKGVSGVPPIPTGDSCTPMSKEEQAALRQIPFQGVQLFFVLVPSGRGEAPPTGEFLRIVGEIGGTWIEPRKWLEDNGAYLRYTDGLHLDRVSAQKVCNAIANASYHKAIDSSLKRDPSPH